MNPVDAYRARLLERLEQKPRALADAIAETPEHEWLTRRSEADRTIHQTMAHVRDVEVLAFLPRLRRILAEDAPTLEAFPTHEWTTGQYDPAEPMTQLLADYARAREEELQLLRDLDADGWSRIGFHPPSGNRTTMWWAERMLAHALEHRAEIRSAL